jgi:hypothetical protein
MALDALVLTVVFAAVFFYVLYAVIRAAVRDGILQAEKRQHMSDVPRPDDSGVRS